MGFKIDTTTHYTTIFPEAEVLDATMADLLRVRCQELRYQGHPNFIIDLSGTPAVSNAAFEALASIHEESYEQERSAVFTGIAPNALRELKKQELHEVLNITPTMQEAIDMVMMEKMERDLFKDESL